MVNNMRKKIVLILTVILLLLSVVPVSAEGTSLSDSCFTQYGFEDDEIIAHSSFDFISLNNLYLTCQEYPIGNLVADSYIYETRKNGINDIDVALVSLETIQDTFSKGDITAEDVFDICSLDESDDAEQTLICIYITGKELRFLVESDASLGPTTPDLKLSYSGLRYSYNEKRVVMDKVVDIKLHDEFGIKTDSEIEDNKLYKICCNVYVANILGRLNELTKGVISIIPKNADGSVVENLHDCEILTRDGLEMKEWYAIADYLRSLDEIPRVYEKIQGRKQKLELNGIVSIFGDPGLATYIAIGLGILFVIILFLFIKLIKALLEAFFKEGKHSKKNKHD